MHKQFGDGYTNEEYVATKYHYPKYVIESDNSGFNVSHSNSVHIDGKISTDTIKSWKDKYLLPPHPPFNKCRI